MTDSNNGILIKSHDKLRDDGVVEFLISSVGYVKRNFEVKKAEYLLLIDEDIRFESKEKIVYNGAESGTIYKIAGYAPMPEQLQRLNEISSKEKYDIYRFDNVFVDNNMQLVRTKTSKHVLPMGVGNINDDHPKERRWCTRKAGRRLKLPTVIKNRVSDRGDLEIEVGFLLGAARDRSINPCTWRTENLPKLRLYEYVKGNVNKEVELVFLGEISERQRATLSAMGYDPNDVITTENKSMDINSLFVPEYPMRIRDGQFSVLDSDLRWVRNKMISNMSLDNPHTARKIYVSRETANRRKITNEDEIVSLLDQYGFEKIEPANLSLEDEISIFNTADVILGLHGANMAGIVFAENARVLELFPKGGVCEHYFAIANQLDLSYDCFICETSKEQSRGRHKDITVNKDKLVDFINYNNG